MVTDTRTASWTAVHDPATSAAELAAIAAAHPEFADAIARHPNAYPDLVAWARGVAAATSDETADDASEPARVSAAEPASSRARPSRVGQRWWIAVMAFLVLEAIVAVGVLDLRYYYGVSGNGYGAWAPVSAVATLALIVLPAIAAAVSAPTLARRLGAVALALLSAAILILVSVPWVGAYGIEALYLPPFPGTIPGLYGALLSLVWAVSLFAGWAISRPLRGVGYLGIIALVVAASAAVVPGASWFGGSKVFAALWIALPAAAAVAGALLLSAARDRRHPLGARRRDVAEAAAIPGSDPGRTNTMAILSLVFGFIVSLLAVIFGHIALSQIARTGEQGRGLAIAGLVLGYVGLGLGLASIIFYGAVWTSVLSGSGY